MDFHKATLTAFNLSSATGWKNIYLKSCIHEPKVSLPRRLRGPETIGDCCYCTFADPVALLGADHDRNVPQRAQSILKGGSSGCLFPLQPLGVSSSPARKVCLGSPRRSRRAVGSPYHTRKSIHSSISKRTSRPGALNCLAYGSLRLMQSNF